MSHSASLPDAMSSASVRVAAAIEESAAMMSTLRFMRSAHTPPKIDTIAWGTKPKITVSATTMPSLYVSVRYQSTAYWTSMEPSSETVCPERKSVMLRRQWAGSTSAADSSS